MSILNLVKDRGLLPALVLWLCFISMTRSQIAWAMLTDEAPPTDLSQGQVQEISGVQEVGHTQEAPDAGDAYRWIIDQILSDFEAYPAQVGPIYRSLDFTAPTLDEPKRQLIFALQRAIQKYKGENVSALEGDLLEFCSAAQPPSRARSALRAIQRKCYDLTLIRAHLSPTESCANVTLLNAGLLLIVVGVNLWGQDQEVGIALVGTGSPLLLYGFSKVLLRPCLRGCQLLVYEKCCLSSDQMEAPHALHNFRNRPEMSFANLGPFLSYLKFLVEVQSGVFHASSPEHAAEALSPAYQE